MSFALRLEADPGFAFSSVIGIMDSILGTFLRDFA